MTATGQPDADDHRVRAPCPRGSPSPAARWPAPPGQRLLPAHLHRHQRGRLPGHPAVHPDRDLTPGTPRPSPRPTTPRSPKARPGPSAFGHRLARRRSPSPGPCPRGSPSPAARWPAPPRQRDLPAHLHRHQRGGLPGYPELHALGARLPHLDDIPAQRHRGGAVQRAAPDPGWCGSLPVEEDGQAAQGAEPQLDRSAGSGTPSSKAVGAQSVGSPSPATRRPPPQPPSRSPSTRHRRSLRRMRCRSMTTRRAPSR